MAVYSVASAGEREGWRLTAEALLAKTTRHLGAAALILLLSFLSIYPLAMLFYGSIHSTPPGEPGVFNLNGYREMATMENVVILANTAGIALITTTVSLSLAVFMAWIVSRTDTPYRRQF